VGILEPSAEPPCITTSWLIFLPSLKVKFVFWSCGMPEMVSRKGRSWMLGFQLLAGPILWSFHFIVGYLLIEVFCRAGWNFQILGMNGLSFLVIALTVLAVLGAILFGVTSYRGWREVNPGGSLWDQLRNTSRWSDEPTEFVYFSGFLLSVFFAITIVMVGLPALFLHPC
jgi:hypothetical protein